MAIKGQALADFISEFRTPPKETMEEEVADEGKWELYVNVSSKDNGAGTGLMLISLEGHKIHCILRFGFKGSNNEAE